METLEQFKKDYCSELKELYIDLSGYQSAEKYIIDIINESATILDFAAQYGAVAAKKLIEYYKKDYHKTITVESIVSDKIENFEIFYYNEPVLIITESNRNRYPISLIVTANTFSQVSLGRYQKALLSAELFASLINKSILLKDYAQEIERLHPAEGLGSCIQKNYCGNLIVVNDERFKGLFQRGEHNLHSYWEEITFTDWQDDVDGDPTEKEQRVIEDQIVAIERAVKAKLEVSKLWNEALIWAKRIEDVWTKRVPVQDLIDSLGSLRDKTICTTIKEDLDRPGNLIVCSDRFYSILRGSNSLWTYLTDTDFELDGDVVISSEDEIEGIEKQIIVIHQRLLNM